MANCQHGKSIPNAVATSLPENQGEPGRHRCVACAYEEGRREGVREALVHMAEFAGVRAATVAALIDSLTGKK